MSFKVACTVVANNLIESREEFLQFAESSLTH